MISLAEGLGEQQQRARCGEEGLEWSFHMGREDWLGFIDWYLS